MQEKHRRFMGRMESMCGWMKWGGGRMTPPGGDLMACDHTSVSGRVSALSEDSSCQICHRSLCQSCHSGLCGTIWASVGDAELLCAAMDLPCCRGGRWAAASRGELWEPASWCWSLSSWSLEVGLILCPLARWRPGVLLRCEVAEGLMFSCRRGRPVSLWGLVHTLVTGGWGLHSVMPGAARVRGTEAWCLPSPWSPSRPSCELRELPSDMLPWEPPNRMLGELIIDIYWCLAWRCRRKCSNKTWNSSYKVFNIYTEINKIIRF